MGLGLNKGKSRCAMADPRPVLRRTPSKPRPLLGGITLTLPQKAKAEVRPEVPTGIFTQP